MRKFAIVLAIVLCFFVPCVMLSGCNEPDYVGEIIISGNNTDNGNNNDANNESPQTPTDEKEPETNNSVDKKDESKDNLDKDTNTDNKTEDQDENGADGNNNPPSDNNDEVDQNGDGDDNHETPPAETGPAVDNDDPNTQTDNSPEDQGQTDQGNDQESKVPSHEELELKYQPYKQILKDCIVESGFFAAEDIHIGVFEDFLRYSAISHTSIDNETAFYIYMTIKQLLSEKITGEYELKFTLDNPNSESQTGSIFYLVFSIK